MAALEGYVTDTSSALFSLGARIAARPSDEIDHLARHAGLAQGIAQVIAALPRDAARRQLFVPLQLLQQHGVGIEEVFSGRQTPKTRARDRSIDRRGAGASHNGDWAARRMCRQTCGRCSCRLRWCAAIWSGCRALIQIPSCRRRRRGCGRCGHCGGRLGRWSLAAEFAPGRLAANSLPLWPIRPSTVSPRSLPAPEIS